MRHTVFARTEAWDLVEDAGRGYRRVVPSPQPLTIEEWSAVRALVAAGVLVIAAGGGGIPVVRLADGSLRGVEAVRERVLGLAQSELGGRSP